MECGSEDMRVDFAHITLKDRSTYLMITNGSTKIYRDGFLLKLMQMIFLQWNSGYIYS